MVVVLVALGASTLTLFSGFGLGTLLLPAFALVLPLEVAVAATAVVHLANNLWKGILLGRAASFGVVLRFGTPAAIAAFLGAWLLLGIETHAVATWAGGTITPLGLVVGLLIVAFGLFDLVPRLRKWSVGPQHLVLGGALSGFFGGLSGHQGALRSVFLTKLGLTPTTFVATGTLCAILVDVSRLTVYGTATWQESGLRIAEAGGWPLLAAATVAAFAGAVIGKRLLGKVTLEGVRTVVGVLLLLVGALVATGIV